MHPLKVIQTGLSAGAGLFVVGLFSFLLIFPFRWTFFIILALWLPAYLLLIKRLAKLSHQKTPVVPLAAATTMSLLAILSLVEWPPLQWFVILLAGALSALLVALTIGHRGDMTYEYKRVRRLFAMLWTFDAFAAATMLYAIAIFFPVVPFSLLAATSGIVYAGAAFMVWRLYANVSLRSQLPWILAFALIMIEFSWVIYRLPFGYFAAGALTTWIWYVAQLLARFHFSLSGINWKEQRWFLLGNAVAFAAVIALYIRWV